jgi:hypothetical protein
MELGGYFFFAAWAGALAPPALWLYARGLTSRSEIHAVFAVSAILCAITLLATWMILKSFTTDILELGIAAVISIIGTIGVGRISFKSDLAANRDA